MVKQQKLPVLSGKELIRKLEKYGYRVVRQKGSHIRLVHNDSGLKKITVPDHRIIKVGLLHQILKDADLGPDELRDL